MSDEYSKKWKSVDKSLKKVLEEMPSVKAMSKDEWYKFLKIVKDDKRGVRTLHNHLQAGGDGKKSPFYDSATSRLGKYFSDKEKAQKKPEDKKAEKKEKDQGFTKVGGNSKKIRERKAKMPWEEHQPMEGTKLFTVATNREAERLNANDPCEEAEGYAFVDFDDLPKMYAEYVYAKGPIALVAKKPKKGKEGGDDLKNMRIAIEKIKTEAESRTAKRVFPDMQEDTLRVCHKDDCTSFTTQVVILNVNEYRKILASKSTLPALQMQSNPMTELSVAILEPLCYELGLETWWKTVVNMDMNQIKRTLVNIVQIPTKMWKPKENHIHLKRNRALKWRNQDIPEGRILTIIEVPNELVHEVLAISGKHGLIVDLASRNIKEEHEKECASVRLPEEWNIKETLKKIEEMPKKAKEVSRGVVPTRRGFALRVRKDAEAEVTAFLNPEEATRLGPALGIRPKSAWVIKGVPSYADSGMIVKTIAQNGGDSWPGWIVRPRRPLTSNRGRVTTWLVDAVVEPPAPVITLNGFLISIEKYTESTTMTKRVAAWMNVSPKPNFEMVPGSIYDRDEAAEGREGQQEASFVEAVTRTVKAVAKDIVMHPPPSQETEEKVAKRKLTAESEVRIETGTATAAQEDNASMMKRMLDKLDQKDEQINQMMKTIEGLRVQIQSLMDKLTTQTQVQNAEENDI